MQAIIAKQEETMKTFVHKQAWERGHHLPSPSLLDFNPIIPICSQLAYPVIDLHTPVADTVPVERRLHKPDKVLWVINLLTH